ncbi:uncharacterized protein LOC126656991 [Mercurialis annua]|uniref:uncharacterized protein LOC126656991 n=1 Tax=Mercurialis annua TaxID=3986 RepID=UPI00215E368D|nr:uncharacterized protein LOC126656991 [Mercurialis annua]
MYILRDVRIERRIEQNYRIIRSKAVTKNELYDVIIEIFTNKVNWISARENYMNHFKAKITLQGIPDRTNIGQRSGGGWGDKGWIWVENEMKLIGLIFTKEQLKHKWDWMKEQWKIWKDLKGKSTELGWNLITGTIITSNKWWDEKNSRKLSFAKFCEKGIGKELYEKYETSFLNTVATGDYAYAPSSGVLPNNLEKITHDDVLSTQQVEFNIPFTDLLFGKVNLENIGSNASQPSSKKKKRTNSPTGGRKDRNKTSKGKKMSSTEQVTNIVRELNEGMQESMKNKNAALCGVLGDRPDMNAVDQILFDEDNDDDQI